MKFLLFFCRLLPARMPLPSGRPSSLAIAWCLECSFRRFYSCSDPCFAEQTSPCSLFRLFLLLPLPSEPLRFFSDSGIPCL